MTKESKQGTENPTEEKVPVPLDAGDQPEVNTDETLKTTAEKWQQEAQDWKDKYLRLAAEFENFKKRNRAETEQRVKFSIQPFAEGLISCLDDLERALKHMEGVEKEAFQVDNETKSGLSMALAKFHHTLKNFGVEKIAAEKQPFDPNLHEAVALIESDEIAENHIYSEFQAGYKIHDRVLRPAKVQVVKKSAQK